MTRPTQRPCLDCGELHRNRQARCSRCQSKRDHRRNQIRTQYAGTWRTTSRRARAEQPWCTRCGKTTDLTLDHETGTVECRSCNSSHRRNPA